MLWNINVHENTRMTFKMWQQTKFDILNRIWDLRLHQNNIERESKRNFDLDKLELTKKNHLNKWQFLQLRSGMLAVTNVLFCGLLHAYVDEKNVD